MPIAVTIFGVAKRTAPGNLPYGFFRFVRGPDDLSPARVAIECSEGTVYADCR